MVILVQGQIWQLLTAEKMGLHLGTSHRSLFHVRMWTTSPFPGLLLSQAWGANRSLSPCGRQMTRNATSVMYKHNGTLTMQNYEGPAPRKHCGRENAWCSTPASKSIHSANPTSHPRREAQIEFMRDGWGRTALDEFIFGR